MQEFYIDSDETVMSWIYLGSISQHFFQNITEKKDLHTFSSMEIFFIKLNLMTLGIAPDFVYSLTTH